MRPTCVKESFSFWVNGTFAKNQALLKLSMHPELSLHK